VNSLLKTVTRQRRDCDLNPDPSAPESSTLTTRLPSHPVHCEIQEISGITAAMQPFAATRYWAETSYNLNKIV